MLEPLVDQGEHHRVGRRDYQLATARRERHQHTRSQDEEQKRSRQQISPHFVSTARKFLRSFQKLQYLTRP